MAKINVMCPFCQSTDIEDARVILDSDETKRRPPVYFQCLTESCRTVFPYTEAEFGYSE